MKIGIGSTSYFSTYDYEEGFKKIKSHGYDCVDYKNISSTKSEIYNLSDEEFRDFL